MRRLLLPALAVLATLASCTRSSAQQQRTVVVNVKHAAPPRAVYVAALDALERGGYTLRMRLLDQALVTLPAFPTQSPAAEETATMAGVEVAEAGDSTQLTIYAHLVRGDGKAVDVWRDDDAMARVLLVETMISAAIDTALGRLAPGAGKPDRREDSDTYAYGRRNPVRVGGEPGSGAAAQRRFLDGLRGPGGEPVRYRRLGSCCEFRTPHGRGGGGALDAYEVTYDGLERPVVLYIDMYTPPTGVPVAPEGFTSTVEPAAT